MAEHDLEILDSTIHYVEEGEGDPIVFLHGNPTSSYLWRNVIPPLAGEGRCLAPDLIGMGRSGKPDIDYHFVDHARYLDAWFDALDLRDVTLVVHDWGSALGIYWARRHRDRVKGIAMMEAILRPITWEDFPAPMVSLFKAFRTAGDGERLILEQNQFIEGVLPSAVVRDLTEEEMDAYRAPFLEPASRKPVLAWPRQLPIEGEPADVVEIIGESAMWLEGTTIPSLLLSFHPGALVTDEIEQWLVDYALRVETQKIGMGIHYVQEDHPKEIAEAIRSWRQRVLYPGS